MNSSQVNRRYFLGASSVAGLALTATRKSAAGQSGSSNDVIQVGVIGPGGRGTSGDEGVH